MSEFNDNTSIERGFVSSFFSARGAPQVLVLGLSLSLTMFCIVGVIPDVISDRFARLNHGYDGPHCSDFDLHDKPASCRYGADDAQNAAALTSFIRNLGTLTLNSSVGSASDAKGRRGFMIGCMFLYLLPPFVLVVLQLFDKVNPLWFYAADSCTGLLNFMSLPFAMLSDVMTEDFRAQSFGLFLASFYVGFTVAPSFPLVMSHLHVSVLALAFSLSGFLFAVVALPETLCPEVMEQTLSESRADPSSGRLSVASKFALRPFQDMSILYRDMLFCLLSAASFFSGLVYSSDATLVIYYVEEQLNVGDRDLASMFFVMGAVGILIQGFMLQLLIRCLGKKGVLVTAFLSGTVHNLLYGLARRKSTIYIAFCLSQLTKINVPLLGSLAANNAGTNEQGLVQGALSSLSAMADAIGPVALEFIYNHTQDRPGTMFVFASFLYAIGTVIVAFIPRDKNRVDLREDVVVDLSLEDGPDVSLEPLLDSAS